MRNSFRIAFLLISILPMYSYAYEIKTHGAITKNAFFESNLSTGYLNNIGITSSDKLDENKNALEWMIEGSAREDESIPSDSGGEWFRYQHHFFDPVNNKGLDYYLPILGIGSYHITGYMAPDWALEDTTSYSGQFYSIPKAKQYYLSGLTATTKTERDKNVAKTFRALGQVMHTVQDMAQPQHTRNDAHGGDMFGTPYGPQIFGTKSAYETYVDEKVGTLKYTPEYIPSVPTIDSYRKFYTTGDGKGLAEFSNRSFVTAGTNFNCTNFDPSNPSSTCLNAYYSNPVLSVSHKEEIQIADLLTELDVSNSNNLSGVVTFFGNLITDAYSGETFENNRMTTYSIFDKDLINKGAAPAFTLNRANYNKMAEYLIPRAVGYSAGLLNYFFRGQMEATGIETIDSSGISGIDVTIKNTTPNEDMSNGTFFISYRYKAKGATEYAYGLSNGVSSGTLPFNTEVPEYSFTFSQPIPNDATAKQYTLVFQGTLGKEEGAVVGKVVDLGAWEDWESGLTGKHQWVEYDYMPSLTKRFMVGDGFGENQSKVLKITEFYGGQLSTSLPNPMPSVTKISFDYYVKSFSTDFHDSVMIGMSLLDPDLSSYSYCSIGLYNPGAAEAGYCGTDICKAIERDRWVHMELDVSGPCSSLTGLVDGVDIQIWESWAYYSGAPGMEVYIDNIDFEKIE